MTPSNSSWSDFPTIFISKVYSLTLLASYALPRNAIAPKRRTSPRRPYSGTLPIPLTVPRMFDSWLTHTPDLAIPSPAKRRTRGYGGYSDIAAQGDDLTASAGSTFRESPKSPMGTFGRVHESGRDVQVELGYGIEHEVKRSDRARRAKEIEVDEDGDEVFGVLDF